MGMEQRLHGMIQGQEGRLLEAEVAGALGRRLRQFGMIAGTEIRYLGRSPLGSPLLFLVRGTVLALREQDCRLLRVEVEP